MAGVPPATSVVPLEGEGVEGDSGGCVRDSQILSTFAERKLPPVPRAPAPVLVFDACQVGVILRAVLYVEAVIAIGLMYVASGTADWLGRVALVTGGALPAPLLWMTGAAPPWLASACTGALLAAGLVAGLAWRVRGRTPAATTARLAELQSRIRPHFLFNTLNTAIALVREEPAKAEAVLEDLSDLFRHALTERGDSSSVGQEIELARRYLAIEQVRFGERLQVEWALDERAHAARLPPLILQPLVENAVKHGVEPSARGAQLRVSTQVRGQMALIKVTNTVPAGQGHAGHGIALANVRDRLRLLHDLQGGFRTALVDDVYQARIEVPLPARGER